ncbi:poly(U)-specific endoribonuclease-like isoform X2 [Protopterus annectens]|uniref:poly(U)-specific endoribonuclease-like isoform X2 n=1 Tax=Protopterus annectens TaxID=7888 RepID=UPI001CFB5BAB|nr:poly(U)-specific endoribonuclease-like isoform X2 [Protopterus annectens]
MDTKTSTHLFYIGISLLYIVGKFTVTGQTDSCLHPNGTKICCRGCRSDSYQCWCDPECEKYGDCCFDYNAVCHPATTTTSTTETTETATVTSVPAPSTTSAITTEGISADLCASRLTNQCCPTPDNNCRSKDKLCFCDTACLLYGNCCADYHQLCQGKTA